MSGLVWSRLGAEFDANIGMDSAVVPAAWVEDTVTGGPDSRDAFAACPVDNGMPGGMYRN